MFYDTRSKTPRLAMPSHARRRDMQNGGPNIRTAVLQLTGDVHVGDRIKKRVP